MICPGHIVGHVVFFLGKQSFEVYARICETEEDFGKSDAESAWAVEHRKEARVFFLACVAIGGELSRLDGVHGARVGDIFVAQWKLAESRPEKRVGSELERLVESAYSEEKLAFEECGLLGEEDNVAKEEWYEVAETRAARHGEGVVVDSVANLAVDEIEFAVGCGNEFGKRGEPVVVVVDEGEVFVVVSELVENVVEGWVDAVAAVGFGFELDVVANDGANGIELSRGGYDDVVHTVGSDVADCVDGVFERRSVAESRGDD